MKGQRIGYIRVSNDDQNRDRQFENQALDRIFTDRVSGKDTQRPQLEKSPLLERAFRESLKAIFGKDII